MFKDELVAKAKELEINVDDFTEEKDLEKAIADKEKAREDNLDNITDLEAAKKELKKFKEEAKKAFEARDSAKAERRKLQDKVNDLEKRVEASADPEQIKELQKELQSLKDFKKEYDEKLEAEDLKNKSEAEKTKIRFDKELEKLKADMENTKLEWKKQLEDRDKVLSSKDREVESLRRHRLRSEIMEYATKFKAYNPAQVSRLLIDEFTYDADLDKFLFHVKDSKGKITDELEVMERVEKFLSDPENENLVLSDAKGGTGHHDQDNFNNIDRKKTTQNSGKKYDPKDPVILREAELKGLSVEDHIETLKLKDEKLRKIREKK